MNTPQRPVWFITGASRGIGAEIARAALERGDAVVAAVRNPADVPRALGEHAQLLAVALDVTDERQAGAAVAAAIERFGRIDVLVNNAGYGLLSAVEEAGADEVRAVFETNVFGLLNVARAVLPLMRERRSGHVMNLSSLGGYQSLGGWGIYCATKFAVEALTEALSAELAPLGVHATAIEPGFFRTDFLDGKSMRDAAVHIADYAATVGEMRKYAAGVNHQQPGDPRKLALAVLKLADAKQPPLRLPLGADTVGRIRDKHAFVERQLAEWLPVALSTAHAQA
ncbi:MAG: SDR family NAD(P)-dependent oxidoreductase [Aquabacterium sp.]|nr:MAG: SDR family NAD(P)-dependent oxidoreductase [Aquabacterium sp.]